MKIRTQFVERQRGGALIITLLTALIIGFALASYLLLVSNQNVSTMRSLAWNSAVPVLEAGAEEALTQLHYRGITNLSGDGWVYTESPFGTGYQKSRSMGQSYYQSLIIPSNQPVIYAIAYVPVPLRPNAVIGSVFASVGFDWSGQHPGYVSRRARITTFAVPMFTKALVAKGSINMNGNNIATDSFDSTDPKYNTGGLYDKTKSKDHGDVATTSGLQNVFSVGNANIKGNIATGPGGSVSIGPNGSVGDAAWVNAHTSGIQGGHYTDDMNADFPDVQPPFTGGYGSPTGGTINGVTYNYVLGNGNYKLNTMSGTVYVGGSAVLYVPGNVDLSGITISSNACLKFYTGAPSLKLSGNGVVNGTGQAWKFQLFGLPTTKSISITGNGALVGVIYAPQAALDLKGGGNNTEDFSGAGVVNSVTMNGHFNFHYDEGLSKYSPILDYRVTSWNEF
jgi:hypothetical protein